MNRTKSIHLFSKRIDIRLINVFIIVLVENIGYGISLPIIPFYVQDTFGGTAFHVTLLTAIYFLTQSLSSPKIGKLSDKHGRRPILILSQFGTLITLILFGLSPNLIILYLGHILDGVTGGNFPVIQAYVSDISNKTERTKRLGIVNGAYNAGLLIGPALGGLLSARFGYRVPFFIAATASLLTIILSYFLLPSPKLEQSIPKDKFNLKEQPVSKPAPANLNPLKNRSLALLLMIGLADRFAFAGFRVAWPLWINEVMLGGWNAVAAQQAVGWSFSFIGIVGIIAQFMIVGLLVKRWPELSIVKYGLLLRGSAWVMIALFPSWIFLGIALSMVIIISSAVSPSLTTLITSLSDKHGQSIGLLQSSKNVGRFLGSATSGLSFDIFGANSVMYVAGIVSIICSFSIITLKSRTYPHKN